MNFRPAGGRWTGHRRISSTPDTADRNPIAAYGRGGEAIVAFSRGGPGASASWMTVVNGVPQQSAPVSIPLPGQPSDWAGADNPYVAANTNGDAVIVWTEQTSGGSFVIMASVRLRNGVFSSAREISLEPPNFNATSAQVAVAPSGRAIAVWGENDNGTNNYDVGSAHYDPQTKAWTPHTSLLSASGLTLADAPRVRARQSWPAAPGSMDAAGNATVIFPLDGSRIGSASMPVATSEWLAVNSSLAGGQGAEDRFGAPNPTLGISAHGGTVALWAEKAGFGSLVVSRVRPAGSATWGPRQALSDALPSIISGDGTPSLGFDSLGDALTMYQQNDGQLPMLTSPFDGSPPTLYGLSIPAQAIARIASHFTVSPLDAIIGLQGLPQWSFGDGHSATGNAVPHTYARAGTYQATVTSVDLLGQVARRTTRVTVTWPKVTFRGAFIGRWRASRFHGVPPGSRPLPALGSRAHRLRNGRRRVPLNVRVPTGSFARKRIAISLGSHLVPGVWRITVSPGYSLGNRPRMTLARPPEGVVDVAYAAAFLGGPESKRLRGVRNEAWAKFRWASCARRRPVTASLDPAGRLGRPRFGQG